MTESFRPFRHNAPDSLLKGIKYFARLFLDFQFLSIYWDMSKVLPEIKGRVLDVGCGDSPYKFLLSDEKTNYVGIDVPESEKFDYQNPDIIIFNGQNIPFDTDSFDAVICTEVLEHVYLHQKIVDEIYRVLKKDGTAIISVPWSARFHYIPCDYFRYTPTCLQRIFENFSKVEISNRGTEITSISAKIIIIWFRNLLPKNINKIPYSILSFLMSPFICLILLFGHLSLLTGWGSSDDPLGYTVLLKK